MKKIKTIKVIKTKNNMIKKYKNNDEANNETSQPAYYDKFV